MATTLFPQDNANMVQAQWQQMFGSLFTNGVLAGQLNSYVVTTTSGLGISVASGREMVQGFLAQSDAAVPLTCSTADPTNPRIDRAVMHADLSAHTLSVILLTGTPAPSPVPPALTQTSTVWEISLYQVRVNALQTTLSGGSLTDERIYSGYLPLSGGTLTGLLTGTTEALSGAMTQVGGQATVGSFGVAPIVAQTFNQLISVTTEVIFVTFTVPVTGLYRFNAFWTYANSSTGTVTMKIAFTDPNTNAGVGQFFFNSSGAINALSMGPSTGTSIALSSQVAYCKGGQSATIRFTDSTGTPADLVSGMIERLS